jgi:hypothetical protein
MTWSEKDGGETELGDLLCFFVKVTKQDSRAHVVLATSDFFLLEWLRGSTCWLPVQFWTQRPLFCGADVFSPDSVVAVLLCPMQRA